MCSYATILRMLILPRLLHSMTFAGELVLHATAETLVAADWGLNMQVADTVRPAAVYNNATATV
jgi:hypothetical protein